MFFELNQPNLYCFYDRVKHLAVVSLRNILSQANIQAANQWLDELLQSSNLVEGILCDAKNLRHFGDTLPFQSTTLPFVFLIGNRYHSNLIEKVSKRPQQYHCALSYEDAFNLFPKAVLANKNPLAYNSLGASVFYDIPHDWAFVTYYGIVTPHVTAEVYTTFALLVHEYGLRRVRASIYDFRHVTDFDNSNLNTVRQTSIQMNASHDMSHIAVPLIVGTALNENMVRIAMKITPQEERKRIVWSFTEAEDFIAEFQTKRAAML